MISYFDVHQENGLWKNQDSYDLDLVFSISTATVDFLIAVYFPLCKKDQGQVITVDILTNKKEEPSRCSLWEKVSHIHRPTRCRMGGLKQILV